MKLQLAALLTASFALAGCSESVEDASAEFRAGFMDSCQTQAAATGAPDEIIEPLCSCTADKVLDQLGPDTVNIAPPMAEQFITECASEEGISLQG